MDDSDIVESIAWGMIERFGDGAVYVVRALAEAAGKVQEEMLISSKTWNEIIEAIERLYPNT